MMAADYDRLCKPEWRRMKKRLLGDSEIPLHANELTAKDKDKIEAVSSFFREQSFTRLAAIAHKSSTLEGSWSVPKNLVMALITLFRSALCKYPFTGMVVIYEDTDRLRLEICQELGSLLVEVQEWGFNHTVPYEFYLMPKRAVEPGLEIADFIMHAAGGRVREQNNGRIADRRDFDVVFKSVSPDLAAYQEIKSVEWLQQSPSGD